MPKKKITNVLFVCLGNICRSPAGEGVLRSIAEKRGVADRIYVESCGIGGWHVGNPPDKRMHEASKGRGICLTGSAQQFEASFFDAFDFIMASDQSVLDELYQLATGNVGYQSKIYLMTGFSRFYKNEEVPDPYYGGELGFELVLDMLEDSCDALLDQILQDS